MTVDELIAEAEAKDMLYHSTPRKNIKSIEQRGIDPEAKPTIRGKHSYTDEDISIGATSFFSKEPSGSYGVGHFDYNLTPEQIEKKAASTLVERSPEIKLFRNAAGVGQVEPSIRSSMDEFAIEKKGYPDDFTIEPGDYFSKDVVRPTYTVTGKENLELLRKKDPYIGARVGGDIRSETNGKKIIDEYLSKKAAKKSAAKDLKSKTTVKAAGPSLAKEQVDGLFVDSADVPNLGSIKSTLNNYEVLPGVREVSMDKFSYAPSYSKQEQVRTEKLAEEIKNTKKIKPLIVVEDNNGFYVLEGGHRFDALNILGKKSFPAIIVKDLDSLKLNNKLDKTTKAKDLRTKVAEKWQGVEPEVVKGQESGVPKYRDWSRKDLQKLEIQFLKDNAPADLGKDELREYLNQSEMSRSSNSFDQAIDDLEFAKQHKDFKLIADAEARIEGWKKDIENQVSFAIREALDARQTKAAAKEATKPKLKLVSEQPEMDAIINSSGLKWGKGPEPTKGHKSIFSMVNQDTIDLNSIQKYDESIRLSDLVDYKGNKNKATEVGHAPARKSLKRILESLDRTDTVYPYQEKARESLHKKITKALTIKEKAMAKSAKKYLESFKDWDSFSKAETEQFLKNMGYTMEEAYSLTTKRARELTKKKD